LKDTTGGFGIGVMLPLLPFVLEGRLDILIELIDLRI